MIPLDTVSKSGASADPVKVKVSDSQRVEVFFPSCHPLLVDLVFGSEQQILQEGVEG